MKVLVIADDLTGALDSSAAFAMRGMSVICATSPDLIGLALERESDVVAVSTRTRDADEDVAVATILDLRSALEKNPASREAILFKKIDSRMKGNILPELRHLRDDGRQVLVCPAIPRLGRHVEQGHVTGAGVADNIDVACKAGVDRAEVLDASSGAEIDSRLADASNDILLVGAAGLAEGLARKLQPDAKEACLSRLKLPALFAIGSRDPITLAQLRGIDVVPAPDGTLPLPAELSETALVLQVQAGGSNATLLETATNFASGVATWVRHADPASLLACGGATAEAILDALGVGLLEVQGEALPGLPVCTAVDGRPGLQIVTKSGGFGAPDTLLRLVETGART